MSSTHQYSGFVDVSTKSVLMDVDSDRLKMLLFPFVVTTGDIVGVLVTTGESVDVSIVTTGAIVGESVTGAIVGVSVTGAIVGELVVTTGEATGDMVGGGVGGAGMEFMVR